MPRSTCGNCHAVFPTTRAFEMHRVGRFNSSERRCLTPVEMQARGMSQNGRG
jgi:hypothetical protein